MSSCSVASSPGSQLERSSDRRYGNRPPRLRSNLPGPGNAARQPGASQTRVARSGTAPRSSTEAVSLPCTGRHTTSGIARLSCSRPARILHPSSKPSTAGSGSDLLRPGIRRDAPRTRHCRRRPDRRPHELAVKGASPRGASCQGHLRPGRCPSNGVFIACCARAGVERCQAWIQGSVIVDQFGWVCRRDVEVVRSVLANRGWATRGRGTGSPCCHGPRRRVPAPGPRKVHLAAQRPAR